MDNENKLKQEYLGRPHFDPILRALRKSYVEVADKERMLFLPQSIIKQGMDAIEHGCSSEEALVSVLSSMGKLINELHKQAMTRAQLEVQPIWMKVATDNGGESDG